MSGMHLLALRFLALFSSVGVTSTSLMVRVKRALLPFLALLGFLLAFRSATHFDLVEEEFKILFLFLVLFLRLVDAF